MFSICSSVGADAFAVSDRISHGFAFGVCTENHIVKIYRFYGMKWNRGRLSKGKSVILVGSATSISGLFSKLSA